MKGDNHGKKEGSRVGRYGRYQGKERLHAENWTTEAMKRDTERGTSRKLKE